MLALKHTTASEPRSKKARALRFSKGRFVTVSSLALREAIEDAELNAIADEREDDPLVPVTLDDL